MSFSSSTHQIILEGVDNTGMAFRSVATGLSQIATSAFSLYQTYENINRASVTLDRANLMVKRSTEGLDQAQKNYNEAITKFGKDSPQAKDALDKLSIAQDALQLATERQELAQNQLNDSYMRLALSIVPTAITSLDGINKVLKTIRGTTGGLSTDLSQLATQLGGVGGAGAGGAGGIAGAGGGMGGLGGGGAALGGGMVGAAGAVAGITAVALTPLMADFAGKQAEAIAENPELKGLMTIRGGGAMATGTNPFAQKELLSAIQTASETSKVMSNAVSNTSPEERIAGVAGRFQHGGVVTRPTMALVGEAGPEAIVPLTGGGGGSPEVTIQINAPLVYVAGAADRTTSTLIATKVPR